jgi:perosamine synthetase
MIPVCEPGVGQHEEEYLLDAFRSGWISSSGHYLDRFEHEWAAYCDMPQGIAVSNGSVALLVATRLLDIGPGDEVIMPAFTIISCAQAVTELGATPVLIDSDLRTWQMDVSQIEPKITHRTKAIMVVHIYGHPADMDPILELSHSYDIPIIEDAAEAHGAIYKGRKCGGMGKISTFSFYANKLITTGEGGMILCRDEETARNARSLKNLCFQSQRRFYHKELGYNFRLTNLQAALGVAQLERIEEIVLRKRSIAASYTERLSSIRGLALPVEEPGSRNVYWVYGIVLDEATGYDGLSFARALCDAGIETRPFFLGMHEQPAFQEMGLFRGERYPTAEYLARRGLYLPTGLGITENDIDYVCSVISDLLVSKKRG